MNLDLNMTLEIRPVFFISDGTGLTAEGLSPTQPIRRYRSRRQPCLTSTASRKQKLSQNQCSWYRMRNKPIVFDTIVNQEVETYLQIATVFSRHIPNIPKATRARTRQGSSYSVGMSHAVAPDGQYARRIDAINFALDNDDGARIRYYDQADLIWLGFHVQERHRQVYIWPCSMA